MTDVAVLDAVRQAPDVFLAVVAAVVLATASIRQLRTVGPATPRKAGVRRPSSSGRTQHRQRQQQLPQLSSNLARSLRSGATIAQAVAEASTSPDANAFHGDLVAVGAAWHAGAPLSEALTDWAERSSIDGLDLVVAALVLGSQTGGDRAQVLDRVAATLGDRQALESEVVALTSQARASALLITVAPFVLAVIFLAIDPTVVEVMASRPAGQVCLAAGLTLAGANWWWMSRLFARTLR